MKVKNKNPRVPYAAAVYGDEEREAVLRVLDNPSKIVMGEAVREFENKIAIIFGKKFGVMVNSGSSANLLAFEVLNLPKGSEVITPLLTFSTTLAPIVQKGLVPVFADVKEGAYVIEDTQVERLITKKTRALMVPLLLGNVPDMVKLRSICRKHNLYFIEDSCDTLGAMFFGKPTGYYSDISTTSFYASHIITAAAGGGMICFKDLRLANRARVISSWGRDSSLFGAHEKSEDLKKRFSKKIFGEVYDGKFIFSQVGYNFQPLELQGAFGLEQLKKLDHFSVLRRRAFKELHGFFKDYEKYFILPVEDQRVFTNWLAFPLTIRKGAPFSRHDLVTYLERMNIQTRPIFSGNVLRQPGFANIPHRKISGHDYPVTNHIMWNGFLLGCHHGLESRQITHLKNSFQHFLDKFE